MTRKPTRTHPLDRDGNGKPGGSLPGNQTAPMAEDTPPAEDEATPPAEDQPPAETETETPPVEGDAPPAEDAPVTGETEATTEDTPPAEAEADTPQEGEGDTGDDTPAVDAEAIRNGDTPVVGEEGETVQTAAEATPKPEGDEELALLETEGDARAQPVAVRLSALRRLADNRWLYKGDDGLYGTGSGPGFVDEAEANLWVRCRVADFSPSAGRIGGLRVTAFGRKVAARAGELFQLDDDGEEAA